MTDAISRSAVLERLETLCRNYTLKAGYREAMTDAIGEVRNAPALAVATVVYCKDCHHARPLNFRELMVFDSACFVCTSQYGAGTSHPEYEMTGKVVFPKSFCSYGHRRTNGR